jgi:hypothetical protein
MSWVKYELTACHYRPLPFATKKVNVLVMVKDHIDVADKRYNEKIVKEEQLAVTVWKGMSRIQGEVKYGLTLLRNAYVPGSVRRWLMECTLQFLP